MYRQEAGLLRSRTGSKVAGSAVRYLMGGFLAAYVALAALANLAMAAPPEQKTCPKAQVRIRQLVPPGNDALNPRAATAAGSRLLWIATSEDDKVWALDLSSGKRWELHIPPARGLAADSHGSVWAAVDRRPILMRLNRQGKQLEKLQLPFIPTDVAVLPDDTLYASGVKRGSSVVLWRRDGRRWEEVPIKIDCPHCALSTRQLLAYLKLSGGDEKVAVVFPLMRSKLAIVSRKGTVTWWDLPYFAARWAPLKNHPVSVVDAAAIPSIPKPYADVLLEGNTVYCLSFQEGPWKDAHTTKRGRHLVMVYLPSGDIRVAELPFDGCQLVGLGGKVLVVDRRLGVWEVKEAQSK